MDNKKRKKAKKLHKEAMAYADKAVIDEVSGVNYAEEPNNFAYKAYQKAKKAAQVVKNDTGHEPGRSILYRNAVSLAINCDKYDEAKELIDEAISEDLPPSVADELLALCQTLEDNDAEIKSQTKEKLTAKSAY